MQIRLQRGQVISINRTTITFKSRPPETKLLKITLVKSNLLKKPLSLSLFLCGNIFQSNEYSRKGREERTRGTRNKRGKAPAGNGLTRLCLRAWRERVSRGRRKVASYRNDDSPETVVKSFLCRPRTVMAPLGIVSEKWPRRLNLNKRRRARIKRFIGAPPSG